jgi:hypothetical protein
MNELPAVEFNIPLIAAIPKSSKETTISGRVALTDSLRATSKPIASVNAHSTPPKTSALTPGMIGTYDLRKTNWMEVKQNRSQAIF